MRASVSAWRDLLLPIFWQVYGGGVRWCCSRSSVSSDSNENYRHNEIFGNDDAEFNKVMQIFAE